MRNSSLRIIESARFKQEAEQLFGPGPSGPLVGLIWALRRKPFFGQQVKGSDRRVSVLYLGGFAYLVYYVVAADSITLESVLKRKTPIAPGPLGLEP
ncbi:MAG TPA: hypothetical protein VGE98_13065 [Thermoanaerobaculia bacterium]